MSRRASGPASGEVQQSLREALRVARPEPELDGKASEELVEGGVARDHRDPARSGLVDDLVEGLARTWLRRAEERVATLAAVPGSRPARAAGSIRTRSRRASEAATTASSSRRCASSSSVSCGPRTSSCASRPRSVASSSASQHRVVALPACGPAQGEEPERALRLGLVGGREPRHVDRVAGRMQLRRRERERAAADAEDDVHERRRQPQRSSGVPVGVPEEDRDSKQLRQRSHQQHEQRDHVHDDGIGRRRRGSSEAAAASRNRAPRPGRVRAPKVRKRTLPGRSCRCTESQTTVTDSQRAASARTTSTVCASTGWSASTVWVTKTSRIVSALFRRPRRRRAPASRPRAVPESSASRRSALAPPPPFARRAPGRRAPARARRRAPSSPPAARAGPRPPCVTRSGMPPPSVATTARPLANDSMITRPRPSGHEGSTSTVEASSSSETASGSSHSWCSTRPGKSAASVSTTARCEPLPTITSAAAGSSAATRRQAAASPSTFLYASSAPTNATVGRSGSGTGGALGERRQVAERGEHRARRDASRLLDEAGREARDGPRRIGPPDRVRRHRVCERADQPARGRAVEARERPPVAVYLDDHGHAAGGQAPARRAPPPRERDRTRRSPAGGSSGSGAAAAAGGEGRRGGRRACRGRAGRDSWKRSSLGPLSPVAAPMTR